MLRKFHRAGLLGPTIATLAALAILLGLGRWQWHRKAWKEAVITTIDTRAKAAPVDFDALAGRDCAALAKGDLPQSCEYLAVRISGTFDHVNERHVYTGIAVPAGGGIGGQGYWIMTPFKLAGAAGTIAVSRGFVPEGAKAPQARAQGEIEGETTLVALYRAAEPRGTFTAANDAQKNIWFLRDPAELFPADGPVAIMHPDRYFDVLSPTPPGGLPAPTAGRIDIPNRHLEYALTWWGLAVTLLGVYAAFVMSHLKPPQKP